MKDEKVSRSISKEYCGFMLEEDFYALPVLRVQEIVRPMNITQVPHSQKYVKGLINLRGQIVTSIDLKILLKITNQDNLKEEYMNVIMRMPDGSLVSLVVDKILDVFEVKKEHLEKTPDTLDATLKGYVENVYKGKDKLFLLLDVDKLLNFDKGKIL
jgi:purine-binding chemotaxis protein CheW